MPLQTSGFSPTALPVAPSVPGNLGVFKPVLDTNEILALAQQKLAALGQVRQSQVQQQQLDMENRRLADEQSRTRSILASEAQQREQSGAIFGPNLERSQVAAQHDTALLPLGIKAAELQNVSGERKAAEDAYATGLVGPEDASETYEKNADGSYTVTTTQRKNGQVVSQSKKQTFLPPGATAKLYAPEPAILLLSNGAKMNVLYSPGNGYTDINRNPLPHELLLGAKRVDETSGNAPAQTGPQIGVGQTPEELAQIKTNASAGTVTAKAEAQKSQDFPNALQNEKGRDLALNNELRQINDAVAFIKANPKSAVGYASNFKIPGSPASKLHALLTPIQGANFFNSVNSLRNAQGQTGIGRIMQSEVPFLTSQQGTLDQSLDAPTIIQSLNNIADSAKAIREKSRESFNTHFANQLKPSTPSASAIPLEAIAELKANPTPEMRANFDSVFGAGASASAIP